MARLPLVPLDTVDPDVRKIFARMQHEGLAVPNLYRALANSPAMLSGWTRLAWPLRAAPNSPRGLRELAVLRVAQLTGSAYEWAHHAAMALNHGVTSEQLEALPNWTTSDRFDDLTRAVLSVTDDLVETGLVSDDDYAALSSQVTPAAVIEIVLTISFYCCVSRVLGALQIELEPEYEAGP